LSDKINLVAELVTNGFVTYPHLPISLDTNNYRIRVIPENCRLLALKKSQNKKDLLLRVQESIGKKTTARISIDGLSSEIKIKLRPMEIKTIRISQSSNYSFEKISDDLF